MTLSTFAVVIGVLSCLSSVLLCGFAISGLVQYSENAQKYEESLAAVEVFDAPLLSVLIITLIFNVIHGVLSILMIVGVKKTRPALIGPWLILSVIDISHSIVYFFIRGFHRPTSRIILSLVYIALSCMVWYPIYTLWIIMRNDNKIGTQTQREPAQGRRYNHMAIYSTEKAKSSDNLTKAEKT